MVRHGLLAATAVCTSSGGRLASHDRSVVRLSFPGEDDPVPWSFQHESLPTADVVSVALKSGMNPQRKMQKWDRQALKTGRNRQTTRWSRTTSHHPREEDEFEVGMLFASTQQWPGTRMPSQARPYECSPRLHPLRKLAVIGDYSVAFMHTPLCKKECLYVEPPRELVAEQECCVEAAQGIERHSMSRPSLPELAIWDPHREIGVEECRVYSDSCVSHRDQCEDARARGCRRREVDGQ